MGTKPTPTYFFPSFRVTVQHSAFPIPEEERKLLEKNIAQVLREYRWHTNYKLVFTTTGDGVKLEKTPEPVAELFLFDPTGDDRTTSFDVATYVLSHSVAIKASQQLSVIRYGEMLHKIIYARCPWLGSMEIRACFVTAPYRSDGRYTGPGDIVERRSEPGSYFYFDLCQENSGDGEGCMVHLTSIKSIGQIADRIITPWLEGTLTPVDHLPQLTTEESFLLIHGKAIGPREHLIAKWRRGIACGGGPME